MLISKSKFVAGVQCLKRLYLIVHEPELAARPDESGQAIIDQGQEVGLLAQQMFPCRVAVESRDREQAIRATRELIENPEIPAIFEGCAAKTSYTCRMNDLAKSCIRIFPLKFLPRSCRSDISSAGWSALSIPGRTSSSRTSLSVVNCWLCTHNNLAVD
ncbi:MAG: hypothetical protein DMG42_25165 [Acidobacteria bacterium]|nr:MAG: hypothetical protein DMG42_25165 [Acidobacteriota bacterium]